MSKIRLGTTKIDFKTKIDVSRVFAPVVVSGPTNFVINGGFESPISATNWSDGNGGTPSRNTAGGAKAGTYYLASNYDPNSEAYKANYSANSSLTVGSFYSLSVWLQTNSIADTVSIDWSFGTNTGTLNATVTLPSIGTNIWQKFTIANKQCLGNGTLSINFTDNSASFGIDELWVVSGATPF